MAKKVRCADSITGGGSGALDSISGTVITDGDIAIVVSGGVTRTYVADSDSGLAESSPNVIAPDTNAGNIRWILQGEESYVDVLATYGEGVNYTRTVIATALAALGSSEKYELYLSRGTWVIDDDLTIGTNFSLKIPFGTLFSITSGKTLTINGPFEAGRYQVFSGTGSVVFGNSAVMLVSPEWWYSGTGSYHTAINSAIAALSVGVVGFGMGTYAFTGTITLNKDRVHLTGKGPQATVLSYQPTGAGTAIYVYKSGGSATQNILRGFGLQSASTYNFTKVGIETRNVEELRLEDIAINPWNGNNASVGLKTGGKHMITGGRISIHADIPISVANNPDSMIDLDHSHLEDLYLIADVGSCVQIADGANLTNVLFDGHQAWAPKTYGVYWNDTTSTETSLNVSFDNVRIEQETVATDYLFYIAHNSGLYNLSFNNIYGGLTAKGYYLRNVIGPTLRHVIYTNISGNEALNVDATVKRLNLENCYWGESTTATLTGQTLISSTGTVSNWPMPATALYQSVTSPVSPTWTAAMVCGTSGTITLDWATGAYQRIGNMVAITGFFHVQSVNLPVGSLTITGLPFTRTDNSNYYAPVTVYIDGITGDATAPHYQGWIQDDHITISKVNAAGNASDLAGDIKAGTYVAVSGIYFVQ